MCPLLSLFCLVFFKTNTQKLRSISVLVYNLPGLQVAPYLATLLCWAPLLRKPQAGHLSEWYKCILTSVGHRDWGHFPWLFQLHSLLQGAESTMNVILLVLARRVLSVQPMAFNHVELWMCYQSHCLPWSWKGWITGTFFELDFKVEHAISPPLHLTPFKIRGIIRINEKKKKNTKPVISRLSR